MKAMFITNSGSGIGLAQRFERDGHDVLVGLVNYEGGKGVVPTVPLRAEVRAVTHVMSKLFYPDLIIICDSTLSRLTRSLREALVEPRILGPGAQPSKTLGLRWVVPFRGRVKVGDKITTYYKGGGLYQSNTERLMGCALRLYQEPLEMKTVSNGLFLTEFLTPTGKVLRVTEDIVGGICGALLELVMGNISELFESPVRVTTNVGVAMALDAAELPARLVKAPNVALKHLFCMAAEHDSESLNALNLKETMAYNCAYGLDIYEATRRCFHLIKKCGTENLKLFGNLSSKLSPLV